MNVVCEQKIIQTKKINKMKSAGISVKSIVSEDVVFFRCYYKTFFSSLYYKN